MAYYSFLFEGRGVPACGQAVICGVCDTPELWRDAASLCTRVRGACAGSANRAESLTTNIYTPMYTLY